MSKRGIEIIVALVWLVIVVGVVVSQNQLGLLLVNIGTVILAGGLMWLTSKKR